MQCDAAWFLAHDGDAIEPGAFARFDASLRRRERGEPVAYIVGNAGFFGRTFSVGPDVLVPRPETEELMERALAALRARERTAGTFCDVGTGSGILAITAACELPSLRCTAIDVSPAALAVARSNALTLGVAARIEFLESDLLAALPAHARFDCVVANLPYVETDAIAPSPDPVSYEPRLALDGGPDGLDLYRELMKALPMHLAEEASAFMEAGPSSTAFLARLVKSTFRSATITVHHDYAGHPRIVELAL